jgi:hypothetical protein
MGRGRLGGEEEDIVNGCKSTGYQLQKSEEAIEEGQRRASEEAVGGERGGCRRGWREPPERSG